MKESVTAESATRDTTRLVDQRLLRAQKLESLGQLAGGVVHDFNNLLSVVLNYADLVIQDVRADDPRLDDLREIRRAAERATVLARQLLAFGRQGAHCPRVLDLRACARGLEGMLRRLLPFRVALDVLAPPTLGNIRADPGQIEQVIVNLVVNERDAMPDGGAVRIEMSDVTLGGPLAAELRLDEGPFVVLSVCDTGTGMDAETRERIFEPFFTTKDAGRGTGLGLSTVLDVAQQCGGGVRVETAPGHGACFHVYFPRIAGGAALVSAPPVANPARRGTETILLVEEDPQVRAVTTTLLHRYGYRVLGASSAGDALLIEEQHDDVIHLLVADVALARLRGDQLARRLSTRRPDMAVLLLSSPDPTSTLALEPGAVVDKPFTTESLIRAVGDLLEWRKAAGSTGRPCRSAARTGGSGTPEA